MRQLQSVVLTEDDHTEIRFKVKRQVTGEWLSGSR